MKTKHSHRVGVWAMAMLLILYGGVIAAEGESSVPVPVAETPIVGTSGNTPSSHEQGTEDLPLSEEEVEGLRSLAADPEAARSERLNAMAAIARQEGDVATRALVSLIGLRQSDEDEHRIRATGTERATWPTVRHIRERGEKAVPSLCEHLLSLFAAGQMGTSEIMVTIGTLLALQPSDAILGCLDETGREKQYSDEVIERAKRVVTSFALARPK